MEKQYKLSIIKNHKIKGKKQLFCARARACVCVCVCVCVPLKGYVAS